MDFFKKYHDLVSIYLAGLRSRLDKLELASEILFNSRQIVCTGVGKSGFVAMKMHASLASVSVPSIYLHPCEALHGDIGLVENGAGVVIVSKSGNSTEVNALIPFLQERNCRIVAICNRQHSILGDSADAFIPTDIVEEGDALNLLPLISTDISMIIVNMLVANLVGRRNIVLEDFARNHPGGQLGKGINKTLSSLVAWRNRRPFVDKETSLLESTIVSSEHGAGLVCVLSDSGDLIGIVSDGDIRRSLQGRVNLLDGCVGDLVNRGPVTLMENMLVGAALSLMESREKPVFSAPVLDIGGKVAGVITIHDLVRF